MTKIWLKKLIAKLNRSDGISIMAIVALMLIMTIMGGAFTSVMGRWKTSAPMAVNTDRALQLANTAATFALQEASYNFYGGSFNYGTRANTYLAYDDLNNGNAYYWFEMPDDPNDDATNGVDDDVVDDDGDDGTNPDRYTIVATGRVTDAGGNTLAKKQIKVFADINPNTVAPIPPGVHTEGEIHGTGPFSNSHFDMDNPTTGANATYGQGTDNITSGSEAGPPAIVYRNPPVLDSDMFLSMAKTQGHYYSADFSPGNGYPNGSYEYMANVPNVTYVGGNLTLNGNVIVWGIYYVKGNATVFNGNYQMNGIVICEGNLTMNGGGTQSPNLNGGIIQYGVNNDLTGNGQPVDIDINEAYFNGLNGMIPVVTNVTWQEAVSAN